eukprot:1179623-Prorocentrum_minimum.AAC.7
MYDGITLQEPQRSRVFTLWVRAASGSVVVVESPSKAKTIEAYLGHGYTVLASYGHVRDLLPKPGSVLPDHEFDMRWEISTRHEPHLQVRLAVANTMQVNNRVNPQTRTHAHTHTHTHARDESRSNA